MARRASSATKPVWFIIAALVVLVAVAVGWIVKNYFNDPFRTLPPLPVSEFLENGNSLRGNTYKIEGVIAASLAYEPNNRLFSVQVSGQLVPILVPAEFNHLDLRKDQHFQFKVEVADKGILKAKDVRKQ